MPSDLSTSTKSPEAQCEEEFGWPRVYEFAKTRWRWAKYGEVDKEAVDFTRAETGSRRVHIDSSGRLAQRRLQRQWQDRALRAGADAPANVPRLAAESGGETRGRAVAAGQTARLGSGELFDCEFE